MLSLKTFAIYRNEVKITPSIKESTANAVNEERLLDNMYPSSRMQPDVLPTEEDESNFFEKVLLRVHVLSISHSPYISVQQSDLLPNTRAEKEARLRILHKHKATVQV